MKSVFLVVLVLLLCLSCVSAADFYYKVDSKVDLKLPCVDNSASCDNAVTCNISFTYPNGNSFINNKQMSKNNVMYNYTLNDTSIIGDYTGVVFCTNTVNSGFTSFTFQINNTGSENTNNLSMTLFLIAFVGILIVLSYHFWNTDNVLFYPSILISFYGVTLLLWFMYLYSLALSRVFFSLYVISGLVSLIITFLVLIDGMTIINAILARKKLDKYKIFKSDDL